MLRYYVLNILSNDSDRGQPVRLKYNTKQKFALSAGFIFSKVSTLLMCVGRLFVHLLTH